MEVYGSLFSLSVVISRGHSAHIQNHEIYHAFADYHMALSTEAKTMNIRHIAESSGFWTNIRLLKKFRNVLYCLKNDSNRSRFNPSVLFHGSLRRKGHKKIRIIAKYD
jgi:hypothetical protein